MNGYVSKEITGRGVYIFSRMKSRGTWFLKKAFAVCLLVFVYCATYFSGAVLCGYGFGYQFHSFLGECPPLLLKIAIHMVPFCFVAVLWMEYFHIRLRNGSAAFFITAAVVVGFIVILPITHESIAGLFNPVVQFSIKGQYEWLRLNETWFSALYWVAVSLATVALQIRHYKKTDIL